MERYRDKNVLIIGVGKTGFALINFFSRLDCQIKVTDIKPIFDLNKAVKRLKRIDPTPEFTFGEHRDEDFLNAEVIVYSNAVNCKLPQLELARKKGIEVYSEFAFALRFIRKPIIAICGSSGRTAVAHMIGHTLKLEGKGSFVGGNSDCPLIEFCAQSNAAEIDYVIVETAAAQLQSVPHLHPGLVVFTNISETFKEGKFRSVGEYIETKLSIIKNLGPDDYLVVNFDKLANNSFFRNANCQVYWYSRKSYVKMGVINEVQGTHFHQMRIHSNIHHHSEFKVTNMRIVGQNNRENLLGAITACKALKLSDKSIQTCIEKFPGIPHRLEFVTEKNGVMFYNDSKSECMDDLIRSINAFKQPVILIAGGKDTDIDYEPYVDIIKGKIRVMILVGEVKEKMNRVLGNDVQTFIVGSFEESILLAYQKSRTGDTIALSPGNPSTDLFRDYSERGNYYKKLIYQL